MFSLLQVPGSMSFGFFLFWVEAFSLLRRNFFIRGNLLSFFFFFFF